jgi:PIN domain nuclease of toxin-antitoxin system
MSQSSPLLLDTCAAIWFADDLPMANAAINAMNEAFAENVPAYVSPISAWEIGILCSRGRMRFPVPPQSWFKRLRSFEGIALVDLSPEILIASSFLPGDPPRDPADRVLAATAREYGYTLVTRDRPLLDYAEQGYLKALAC